MGRIHGFGLSRRAGVVGGLIAAACLLVPVAASADPDNHLACQLIGQSRLKKFLGVSHVESQATATTPTAPPPDNHTVDGADQVECDYLGFDHKPTKAQLKRLRNARKPIPPGFAFVTITTQVRDDIPNGDGTAWKPDFSADDWNTALDAVRASLGGRFISATVGTYLDVVSSRAAWLGNPDRTSGFWEIQGLDDTGIVVLTLATAHNAIHHFHKLAGKVTGNFPGVADLAVP